MPRKSSQVLTTKFVSNAPAPKDKAFTEYPDAALPGLCLRVYQTGGKSFILSTRVNGKLKRRKIGDADLIPLAEARRLAGDAKDQAKAGQPLARYEAAAPAVDGSMTFGQIAEQYIDRECPKLARGGDTEAIIRRELLPPWRRIPLADLRKRHARELTDAMVKDRPMAAYKLHEVYCRLLNWALEHYDDEEIGIEVSPFSSLKPPVKKVSRGRALTEGEIQVLWRAWDQVGYPYGPLQKLLLLTAQRRGEVAGMCKAEINLTKRIWTIPAARTKSDRAHIVPLSDQAVAILADLPRFTGGDYVFTTTSGASPVNGFSKSKRRTDQLAPDLPTWRLHDLRRTARTGMAELGVPEIVAERILNHMPRGLIGVYDVYQYQPEKAEALQRWANRVTAIVSPAPANVVSMVEAG